MPTWGNSNGGTQYSMARTAADEKGAGRRTLHAWLQNGDSGGGGGPYTHDNAVALPRDISLGPRGDLYQQFVPELLALRAGATAHVFQPALSVPVNGDPIVLAVSSNQLEVVANFSLASPGGGVSFGVFLHMDPSYSATSARTPGGGRARRLRGRARHALGRGRQGGPALLRPHARGPGRGQGRPRRPHAAVGLRGRLGRKR